MIKGGSDVLLDTAAIVVGAGLVTIPFLFVVPPARRRELALHRWPRSRRMSRITT